MQQPLSPISRGLVTMAAFALAACDGPFGIPDAELPDSGADAAPADPLAPHPLIDLDASRSNDGFYDYPYPSDARLTDDGAPDLTGFYVPTANPLVDEIRREIERDIRGFSPSAGAYVRFDRPLDPSSLPEDPLAATADDATVYLVDVDPGSPGYGERWPSEVSFYESGGRYFRPNMLVVRPPLGMPLRPGTTYALVVTSGVRGIDGRAGGRPAAFDALLGDVAPPDREGEHAALRPFVVWAREAGTLDETILASVFTTADHLGELRRLRDWIRARVDTPRATEWAVLHEPEGPYDPALYGGRFEMMDFLAGEPPYDGPGEGVIITDGGEPVAGRMTSVRFALTVPPGDMPAAGWPIALYAHGATGSYRSFVEPEGEWAARVGVAMISMDNPMHGDRNPTGEAFIDFLVSMATSNLAAARDMYRHGVLDQVQLARLACEGLEIPPTISVTGQAVRFDCSHLAFTGHSMGSQIGAVLLAVEPEIRAAFLSEGGGSAATGLVLRKSNDIDIEALVAIVLGIDLDREPLSPDHPVVGLLIQTLLDPGDPLSYAYAPIREAGDRPVSILMTEGLEDDQTIPETIEALAAAYGLPIVEPVEHVSTPHELWGIGAERAPLADNLLLADAPATGGLMQLAGHGHYALYEDAGAQERFRAWLESAAAGRPRIIEIE